MAMVPYCHIAIVLSQRQPPNHLNSALCTKNAQTVTLVQQRKRKHECKHK